MYYAPGSSFAAVAESYTERHAQDHDAALARLEVEALDQPIAAYWYETNALKGEVTGNSGNAHANSQNVEAHHVYNTELDAGGPHEDVHVIAWHRIGDTNYALMGEGLAVWVTGPWWGEPLEDHVSGYKARGVLPSLEALITDFWSMPDGVTYPTAGHFVGWLAEGWGVDVVKRLYVEPDLEAGFQRELGMTLEEVEAAWAGSIP
ncbi:MAG: hypothetical protein H6741_32295, partial [Alphaproteobacteria bacterium]|nr:hypothetical protein [Alphaproteobacteria bacterium]